MTEMAIQQLLLDAGADDIDQDLVMVDPHGLEVAADWRTLQSPETYLGYRQSTGFAQEDVARLDEPQRLRARPPAAPQPLGAGGDLDRGRGTRRVRTSRAHASPSSSTRATSTSSWDRLAGKRRSRSGSSSTARPRGRADGVDVDADGTRESSTSSARTS